MPQFMIFPNLNFGQVVHRIQEKLQTLQPSSTGHPVVLFRAKGRRRDEPRFQRLPNKLYDINYYTIINDDSSSVCTINHDVT